MHDLAGCTCEPGERFVGLLELVPGGLSVTEVIGFVDLDLDVLGDLVFGVKVKFLMVGVGNELELPLVRYYLPGSGGIGGTRLELVVDRRNVEFQWVLDDGRTDLLYTLLHCFRQQTRIEVLEVRMLQRLLAGNALLVVAGDHLFDEVDSLLTYRSDVLVQVGSLVRWEDDSFFLEVLHAFRPFLYGWCAHHRKYFV